jgi:hypothetical protein
MPYAIVATFEAGNEIHGSVGHPLDLNKLDDVVHDEGAMASYDNGRLRVTCRTQGQWLAIQRWLWQNPAHYTMTIERVV